MLSGGPEVSVLPGRIEIVPIGDVVASVRAVIPRTTTISVTSLPHHPIEATLSVASALRQDGYRVIPHLAANRIGTDRQLRTVLSTLATDDIDMVFAIGGDGIPNPGGFPDGITLLERIRQLTGDSFSIGAATYPEAHPHMDAARVLDVVRAKAAHADYLVTQMCFSAEPVTSHLRELAAADIRLPVWIGIPGAVRFTKLLAIAARIGVQTSLSFAQKGGNRRLLGRYSPTELIDGITQGAERATLPLAGFHRYTFNDLSTSTAAGPEAAK